MKGKRMLLPFLISIASGFSTTEAQPGQPDVAIDIGKFSLTREEIAQIHQEPPAQDSALGRKLKALVDRVYHSEPMTPARPPARSGSLSVATWNVAASAESERVIDVLSGRGESLERRDRRIDEELRRLSSSDVLLLQEVSLPLAREIAGELGLHLVWGPEFVEVGRNATDRDPEQAETLTGNAILSRYPLGDARMLRFRSQGNWYEEEKRSVPLFERGKRVASKKLFSAPILAGQVRAPPPYGGRMALFSRAEIPDPNGSDDTISIDLVNMHLEDRARPDLRREQMREVLEEIRQSPVPVIFGGDLNTHGKDGRVQTTGRFLGGRVDSPRKIAETGVSVVGRFVPFVGWGKTGLDALRFVKSRDDPTSVFNPERGLFDDVAESTGAKPLNQRDRLGYKHTWATPNPRLVGAGILDFLFLSDPTARLAVGETRTHERLVQESVKSKKDRVSDHFPVQVDLEVLRQGDPPPPATPSPEPVVPDEGSGDGGPSNEDLQLIP